MYCKNRPYFTDNKIRYRLYMYTSIIDMDFYLYIFAPLVVKSTERYKAISNKYPVLTFFFLGNVGHQVEIVDHIQFQIGNKTV